MREKGKEKKKKKSSRGFHDIGKNVKMKATSSLLKSIRVPRTGELLTFAYSAPVLSGISIHDLPNSSFEKLGQYYIKKTANGYWPVYKKIQNTKVTTEIKRIEGNVGLFAKELLTGLSKIDSKKNAVKTCNLTGQVTIKGDFSEEIKHYLNKSVV